MNKTPSSSVRTTFEENRDVKEERVLKPEDAAEYFTNLEGVSYDEDYRAPAGMPDPEEFSVQDAHVEAEVGETLEYEIKLNGYETWFDDVEDWGRILKDEEDRHYVTTEDGDTHKLDEETITFTSEAETADRDTREIFSYIVERLGN
jgi:hypothetical protein